MSTTDDATKLTTFDDAHKATSEMMAEQPPAEEQPAAEKQPAQDTPAPASEQPPVQEPSQVADDAVKTAEQAAQVAQEKDQQLQQALATIEQLKSKNTEFETLIGQMSDQQKEKLVEEVMQMPVLDLSSLAFDDAETIKTKQSQYAEQMAQFIEKRVNDKYAPLLQEAQQAQAEKQKTDVITALSSVPELNGISEMLPQLEKIIANNKALSAADVPLDEKYITAFAIAKGVNALNTPAPQPKELTPQELLALYENNKEFQDLVEQKRLEKVKGSQQVPTFSASSGAVNAALNIKEKPKTFEEAAERTRQMFGN